MENVSLQGMLPYLDNFKRISSAHIGCVFYEDNLNNRIGLPNRAFEYMYCNLAILGDDFEEIRRLVMETDCGIIVDSKNAESTANAIENLVKNPDLIKQYAQKGKKAVESKYNFENAANEMVQLYVRIK